MQQIKFRKIDRVRLEEAMWALREIIERNYSEGVTDEAKSMRMKIARLLAMDGQKVGEKNGN